MGDDQVPEGRRVSIIDDTADDFVGTRTDTTIAARGSIEPEAFILGGLHARAYDDDFPHGSTYTRAIAEVTDKLGRGYRQVPFRYENTGVARPRGLSIGIGDFSILYDGEIRLPAGEVTFEVACDDSCALELMLDGATWTESLIDTYNGTDPSRTYTVPADGWYPIRAAFTQGCCSSFFDVHFTPAGGTRTHLDENHTRARVTDASGLFVDVFQIRAMVNRLGHLAVDTIDHDFGVLAPPFDLSNMPSNDFTLRHVGQLRIDEPGAYTFTANSSTGGNNGGDLWRVWIDGKQIAGTWSPTPTMSATIELEAGWHDFGFDFAEDDNDARVEALMSGPQIPMGVIDSSRLRPVITTGHTSVFANLQTRTQIADATNGTPTTTAINLTVPGEPGATVVSIDWGLGIELSRMTDLTGVRVDCTATGTPIPLQANPGYYYFPGDTSCANAPLPLEWKYAITDSVTGGTQGNVWNPVVAVTYRGGESHRPFPDEAIFVSSVRETPGAIGYGRVKLDATLRGGGVMLEVRTAADAASIESATWVEVADNEVPAVEPGAVLQYRARLRTHGWELVSVDRVEIVYIVPE